MRGPTGERKFFTEATVPKALLETHSTKRDVWAYRISDPARPVRNEVLTSDPPPGVIERAILHEVAPLGPVRFYVKFHRREQAC